MSGYDYEADAMRTTADDLRSLRIEVQARIRELQAKLPLLSRAIAQLERVEDPRRG